MVTLSPGLTSTSVSRPPVEKLTAASLGELSEPEPDTVASTVPLATATVRAPLRAGLPLSPVTAAYAPPAPARTATPSTELIRTALRRRGSTFMEQDPGRPYFAGSGSFLGVSWERHSRPKRT